jgi:UDP-N-acetylglucosamine 2-epimerase (non-hydrolysing)
MKILIAYGTRPEFLKLKKLINIIPNADTLRILQHGDIIDFGNPTFTLTIEKKCNSRLNNIFSEIFIKIEDILNNYDAILIQGDTATVAACAISAFNLKKKIIYLESGLRSFDFNNPYPEEAYRQMVSRIADINLCPTKLSELNLKNENILGKSFVIGNTSLDNLLEIKEDCNYKNKVLITLHRSENHLILKNWYEQLDLIAEKYKNIEFIYPIHPNPLIIEESKILKKVKIINPLPHADLLSLMKDCKLIITDSGGIQEEASFLNKKIIVCRKTTERPEGINSGHIFLCKDPIYLFLIFESLIENFKINEECPYGDGFSCNKILNILKKYTNEK